MGVSALQGMRARLGMWVLGVGYTVMRCIVRTLERGLGKGNGVRSGRRGQRGFMLGASGIVRVGWRRRSLGMVEWSGAEDGKDRGR